jgi:hypothetical protein
MQTTRRQTDTDLDDLTEARRRIDATIVDVLEDRDVTHQELIEALSAARDALLVNGRVPKWYGDESSPHYREMCWGFR